MDAETASLDRFDTVIDALASDPRFDDETRTWLNEMYASAGDKVRVVRYILKHATAAAPRVLDVGAQIGALARFAQLCGCRAAAVDYPPYTAKYGSLARENGVDYRACDVRTEGLPFDDASFDFVTYTDVIEHHSFSPKRVLGEMHRVLAPGGRVIVTTPNHASIYNRLTLLAGKSVNDSFDYYFDGCAPLDVYPGHHREYTRRELRAALERTGFDVEECRVMDEDVRSLVRAMRRRGLSAAEIVRQRRALVARALGNVWNVLHLPLGRFLWAVGRKS